MAQFGKASSKRSKPSYIYSIVGVALVLLIMGILGWIFLNFSSAGNSFKEDIRISAYLRTTDKDTIQQIQKYIAAKPYAKNVQYITKEGAKEIWGKEGSSEDWAKILDYNPLPESIDFYAKSEYVNQDSLNKISSDIVGNTAARLKTCNTQGYW
jgi:cell division transport system permease protein